MADTNSRRLSTVDETCSSVEEATIDDCKWSIGNCIIMIMMMMMISNFLKAIAFYFLCFRE